MSEGAVSAAGMTLRLPAGCSARLISDPDSETSVEEFVRSSPDHTVYHRKPYLDFARAENGRADLLLVTQGGNPQFALPLHPTRILRVRIATGYSGVVFPPTRKESVLKRAVRCLGEFLSLNRHFHFECIQAAQAATYDDNGRVTLIARLLESEDLIQQSLYTRVLELSPQDEASPSLDMGHGRLPASDYVDGDLQGYDPAVRNKIRQAAKSGLSIEYCLTDVEERRQAAYEAFQPVHAESWSRTGMEPHSLDYWLKLSRAVHDGGGSDLVVLAVDGDKPVAGVTCHLYGSRAIYWAGASVAAGLKSKANPLSLHAAITLCRALGTRAFELGRFSARETSEKEIAITTYKAQFGGELLRVTSFWTPWPRASRVRTLLRRFLAPSRWT
jgi:hypothetical protein